MIKFIRYLISGWQSYPSYQAYWSNKQELLARLIEDGEWTPKNRLDFAWRHARAKWRHRDRYGRKCRKANGDCDKCNAKHC